MRLDVAEEHVVACRQGQAERLRCTRLQPGSGDAAEELSGLRHVHNWALLGQLPGRELRLQDEKLVRELAGVLDREGDLPVIRARRVERDVELDLLRLDRRRVRGGLSDSK